MTARSLNRLPAVATVATSLMVLSACGGGGEEGPTAAGGAEAGGDTPAAAECEETTLRLTHQWPAATADEGDFRAVVAQRLADQVAEETGGQLTVEIFPSGSLVGATEQYDSMMEGATDMSVFPLDYASGRVPDFSVTLMPALVRSHEEAQAWHENEIGERLDEVMDENGVRSLVDIWNAGAIGAKGDPIVAPDDVPAGSTMRAAGSYVEGMLESAGAGITSLPSSEIYTAMQTGVLDAAVTSTGSFASYNLQEQVDSFTSPSENTFWFMYEPLIISNRSFEGLCADHQEVLTTVGEGLQEYAFTASEEDDARVEQLFADVGVEVVQMPDEAFLEWRALAKPQWDEYAQSAPNGQELLDLALEVSDKIEAQQQ